MGQLLGEMTKYLTIENESVSKSLDQPLERRNFLMHKFFLVRKGQFEVRRATGFEEDDGRLSFSEEA